MQTDYVAHQSSPVLIQNMICIQEVDRKEAQFIGNKQIHSQTHKHSTLYISVDIEVSMRRGL